MAAIPPRSGFARKSVSITCLARPIACLLLGSPRPRPRWRRSGRKRRLRHDPDGHALRGAQRRFLGMGLRCRPQQTCFQGRVHGRTAERVNQGGLGRHQRLDLGPQARYRRCRRGGDPDAALTQRKNGRPELLPAAARRYRYVQGPAGACREPYLCHEIHGERGVTKGIQAEAGRYLADYLLFTTRWK